MGPRAGEHEDYMGPHGAQGWWACESHAAQGWWVLSKYTTSRISSLKAVSGKPYDLHVARPSFFSSSVRSDPPGPNART